MVVYKTCAAECDGTFVAVVVEARPGPTVKFLQCRPFGFAFFLLLGVLFWPSLFLEAWGYQGQQNHISQNQLFLFALPPSAARTTQNHMFLETVWFFGRGTPRPRNPELLRLQMLE